MCKNEKVVKASKKPKVKIEKKVRHCNQCGKELKLNYFNHKECLIKYAGEEVDSDETYFL